MVETTVAELGRLNVLVNNAGVMLLEAVTDADTDDWRRMVEVNLPGLMNATHAALPVMEDRGSGHVVTVSSVAGRQASATASGYNATKFGVNGFTGAFRQEVVDESIRTTVVEPGLVETELKDHIPDEEIRAETERWLDSLEPPSPEDVARSIRFAVSQPDHVSVNELLIRPTEQEL
jgi:NADP-dependent 3-hydroxy acid dehydrogenase YdfG